MTVIENGWTYLSQMYKYALRTQKCSSHINCTCGKCAIYGQISKSGAMMGIEIYKFREHTVLALTLGKI